MQTGRLTASFEVLNSSIAWRVIKLQRLAQYGQIISFKVKIACSKGVKARPPFQNY